MLALRSNWSGFVLVPVLLLASLVLPTLHIHPVHEYDNRGHLYQHTIIHADFFSVAARDHHFAQHENAVLGESEHGNISQIALAALFVRSADSLLRSVDQSVAFFPVDSNLVHTRSVLRSGNRKRDRSPPVHEFFLSPNAPRSPPSFA